MTYAFHAIPNLRVSQGAVGTDKHLTYRAFILLRGLTLPKDTPYSPALAPGASVRSVQVPGCYERTLSDRTGDEVADGAHPEAAAHPPMKVCNIYIAFTKEIFENETTISANTLANSGCGEPVCLIRVGREGQLKSRTASVYIQISSFGHC